MPSNCWGLFQIRCWDTGRVLQSSYTWKSMKTNKTLTSKFLSPSLTRVRFWAEGCSCTAPPLPPTPSNTFETFPGTFYNWTVNTPRKQCLVTSGFFYTSIIYLLTFGHRSRVEEVSRDVLKGSVGESDCVPGRGGWCGGASATSWFAPLWRSFSGSPRPAGSYPLFL